MPCVAILSQRRDQAKRFVHLDMKPRKAIMNYSIIHFAVIKITFA